MIDIKLFEAQSMDMEAYAHFQKEAYRDLLARSGFSDSHMTAKFYKWKYNAPAGAARVAAVIEKGEIISSSAIVPFRICYKNKDVLGWQCLDVATLPQARRKGYFFSTLKFLKDTLPQDEIFFAFPNSGSLPSFEKLSCRENIILTTWLNPFVYAGKETCKEIIETSRFDHEHDAFIRKINTSAPFLKRSSGYLNWRYCDHPNNHYAVFSYQRDNSCCGFAVTRKANAMGRDIILVMELWGLSRDVEIKLLRHINAWAVKQDRGMAVMMNTSVHLIAALRAFFFPVPSFLLPKRQVLVVYCKDKNAEINLNMPWNVQTGDWDVF